MSRVVVTGLAGSLGQRVASLLAGHLEVTTLVGIDIESSPALPSGAVEVTADLQGDPEPIRRAMAGASAVVHLAWQTPDSLHHDKDDGIAAWSTNLASLRQVLDLAAEAGVDTVVHLSSATVYGAWPDNPVPLSEDAALRPNPEFSFAVSKAEAERTVAAWADSHPAIAVAVLRPTVTLGTPVRPLYQALGGTRSPRGGDGGRTVQFVHVDDLASAVVLAWKKRLRGVYNVAPDGGIGEDTARALAGGVAKVALPGQLAHAVAAWSWRLWRLGSPREAQAYARWPWSIAPDRLLAAGWVPQHTSEEALVATDERAHWDDLPPGRRQNLTVLAAAGAVVAAAVSAAGLLIGRSRRARASDTLVRRLMGRTISPGRRRRGSRRG
ncbi:MAG: NAD-dependent epimerase/dehydratase family protein [Actinomycetota bacterium]|nr:NAD-dependent epimerase/dehydratase family protein [Actinomycetota bacterium]